MAGALRKLAQIRIDEYTGEKYCQALTDIRSLVSRCGQVAIPNASLEQARLEAALLWAVGYGIAPQAPNGASHPFGIVAASPSGKGLQLVVGPLGSFLLRIVPRLETGSVCGIPGLRVRFTNVGALLTQFGSKAVVLLRDVDAVSWRDALDGQVVSDPESLRESMLCNNEQLHPVEAEELAEIRRARTESSDTTDRIMSGLLRRPHIFSGTPLMKFVDFWRVDSGERSTLQIEWAGHLTHGQVIEKLIDKRFGLPLEMVDGECCCDHCSEGVYGYRLRDKIFGSVDLRLRRSTLYDDELEPLPHAGDRAGVRSCSLARCGELGIYRKYTGEAMQYAKQQVKIDRKASIPAAHDAQARLESWIFRALAAGPLWAAHPFAISRVRPTSDGSLVVFLDRKVIGFSEPWDAAQQVLQCLAPVADSEGEFVTGVPGLRVGHRTRTDLEMTLIGTSASVVLRAASGVSWSSAMEGAEDECASADRRLIWHDDALIESERTCIDNRIGFQGSIDWLCSGLLRRIGLLHFGTNAYMFSGWTSGAMLKLELTSARPTSSYHDSFIEALTDSNWGLPLTVRKRRCDCPKVGEFSSSCWIELALAGSSPDTKNILQLRFNHDADDECEQLIPELLGVGADPAWLQQVLPHCT
ncbi:hypothetical protein IU453_27725 [Nocardia cyriacigeorgica]|uniref:hypothetical protein n=1 Tax=Nocardia cyriacigeorgica TaxID=135487 RepID=UPI001894ABAC|nr:hypothetical protein [Nocardia cyriacigeorgica]MBF6320538.1 hypothetical protein [Nocardia cyriacigeorgica]MBF6535025.1 hypothetical protein [Nocardia cyriacigeorgica]